MIEPMLGLISLYTYINDVDWTVVGSETGGDESVPLDLEWVKTVRNETKCWEAVIYKAAWKLPQAFYQGFGRNNLE